MCGTYRHWYLISVSVCVCVLHHRANREGVVGGQTGSLSQSWVYDDSNSIELVSPGLGDLLPVGICVCLCVNACMCIYVCVQSMSECVF